MEINATHIKVLSFHGKISGAGVIRMNHSRPCIGLSISRQPHARRTVREHLKLTLTLCHFLFLL